MSIKSDCENFLTIICLQGLPENELAIISVEDRVMETNSKAAVRGLIHNLPSLTHIWIQESSENPREVVPTTAKYISATGKQALTLLQSAATLIPVPLIKEAIAIALKIIDLCEVCKIPLRKGCKMVYNYIIDRIYLSSVRRSKICKTGYAIWWWLSSRLLHPRMKTAVTTVTKLSWRLRRVLSGISRTYSGICSDIAKWSLVANYVCYSTLKKINEELDKIAAQGPWKLGIYSDLNVTAVDDCLNRLSTALEKFKVCPTSHILGAWHNPFYSLLTTFATPTSSSYSMHVYRRIRIWLNM